MFTAAFLGLHFDGSLDATGIATVLLALATFGLAIYTRQSVRQNATELEQSQRPVLVPLTEGISERPEIQEGRFFLPVINVGVGPAMDIRADIEFGDTHGNRTDAPYVRADHARTAIGAGQQTYLAFEDVPLASAMGFAFHIEFTDVGGMPWFSRGLYSEAEHVFRQVEVVRGSLSEADRIHLIPRGQ